jgi:hypothetical protein
LVWGTGKMLIGLAKGIGGLVYEPIKGAKENGFRGATKGIGKGILGLVCKPVAGTLDFVTLTLRGASNTPSSMFRSVVKMYQKNKAKREKEKRFLQYRDSIPSSDPHLDSPPEEEKANKNLENDEVVNDDDIIVPILDRNSKLREWLVELAKLLGAEVELLFEELELDDPIELRLQEAKQLGKRLKREILDLIEDVKRVHKEEGLDSETVKDFNTRIVTSLKTLGVRVDDVEVLSLASEIEENLFEEESDELPVVQVEEVKVEVVNPFIESAKLWQPVERKDDYRVPEASSKGGIPLIDPAIVSKLRSVGKEIIKSVGKKVLQGDFNLTTISFPIRCMQPFTSLHNTLKSMTLGPLFFTKAALASSPVERLKFLAVATMGTYRNTTTFMKPVSDKQLNPIIGETLTAEFEDGTRMYCEQTCNHPPVSHFLILGPDDLYRVVGYTLYETSAGFNNVKVPAS